MSRDDTGDGVYLPRAPDGFVAVGCSLGLVRRPGLDLPERLGVSSRATEMVMDAQEHPVVVPGRSAPRHEEGDPPSRQYPH